MLLDSLINESKFMLFRSEYSYDQYHWCPVILIVIEGWEYSSDKYKIFIDGRASRIRINAGMEVQKYSTSWFSEKNRLRNELQKDITRI